MNDPAPPSALERLVGRLASVGPARVVEVEGVRYRERRPRPLRSAFGAEPGVREYEVFFPDADARRRPMRIRATPTRLYDDLTPDPRVEMVRRLDTTVRPGDRVLELGCGTGGASRHLAYLVGPSGGVVALDRDGESVRFARQRYAGDQLGFELGWVETLSGELDGAFDCVVVTDPFRDARNAPERERALDEILRVLRPGGHLLCLGSSDEPAELARRELSGRGLETSGDQIRSGGWRGHLWRRPSDARPRTT